MGNQNRYHRADMHVGKAGRGKCHAGRLSVPIAGVI
jgi:hypothetical protein